MSNKVVIGMGFGDEGKGVATEYLCSQDPKNTIVVRFSGGHQAGHKVIKDNVEHIFSSFAAGTLNGCPTYWSRNCTLEPVAFWNEFEILKCKGIVPKIYINPGCPITTIFDVFANRNSIELDHGTTGTGFFRTIKRHSGGVCLTADMIFYAPWEKVVKKIIEIQKYYDIDINVDEFTDALIKIRSLPNKQIFITNKVPNYQHKVFEGSQGLMLDEHIGYMPHCTPSDITPRSIINSGHDIDEVYLITRAYQTRHGNGPMTNEEYKIDLKNNEKETNVSNKYQGKFRVSVLDLDQLIHAKLKGIDEVIPKNVKINLIMTCIDQVSEYRVSHRKEITHFGGAREMAKCIGKFLNINGDLYINDSPYSGAIRKI